MIQEVVKRDCRIVKFDKNKIENVVLAAFQQVDKKISKSNRQKARGIANYISNLYCTSLKFTVKSNVANYITLIR